MSQQFQHAMLPKTTHDELSRQNFMASLKSYITRRISPGTRLLYEKKVLPDFEQTHQRSPQDHFEVRTVMQHEPYYCWWSALRRTQQEMMWESVCSSVERQRSELIERAKDRGHERGTVTLDPDFKVPAYQTAVDIHCMPGGYTSDLLAEDVTAGAVYDRGTYLYGVGWLGALNDQLGQCMIENYLKPNYPEFQPRRILDLGCSVGHSTLPYVDAYPEAEVCAIDLGAAMLRYAHARAEALGKRVHFSQQNAECTNFADASFDLIVSHILLHEIPQPVIDNVLRECRRLLAPGGLMLHVEAPPYSSLDAFTAFIYDWETANNNEPFWSNVRQMDLGAAAVAAGFAVEQVAEVFVPRDSNTVSNSRGSWFVLVARQ